MKTQTLHKILAAAVFFKFTVVGHTKMIRPFNAMVVCALILFSLGIARQASAQVFINDSFRIVQEAATSFSLLINNKLVRTLRGNDMLEASFSQGELTSLLLANNNFPKGGTSGLMTFTKFSALELRGLMKGEISADNVTITFDRQLITENRSGYVGLKYTGPRGIEHNFVKVRGVGDPDTPMDRTSLVVSPTKLLRPPGRIDERGGKGPFFNDTFTITQNGALFLLDINGVQLTPIGDIGGDVVFQIPTVVFKQLVLANNGVSGSFLGDDTFFFEFLAKGNSGLIDVALRKDTISFKIAREFVESEMQGESSFKYNALGQPARNFINFVGVVN